jgi:ABC-type Zn uptake system ZnuABC Zn-binding protein ZnuA
MKSIDAFLNDNFFELSEKLKELYELKKEKKAELKKIYEQFQAELKVIDEEANELVKKWESEDDKKKNPEKEAN